MIFDAEAMTLLVMEWQRTKSDAVLARICSGTTKLIEVIVSYYDPLYRDDMIQECRLRLISGALQGYDKFYSLHTYLTTVFHNVCKTFMKKQYRISNLFEDYDIATQDTYNISREEIIEDTICRNRERFPSIPAEVIDDMTEYIVTELSGSIGKRRGMVAELMKNFCISRHIATIVYHSTIIYMRSKYDGNVANASTRSDEFSLMPDLCEMFGDAPVKRLMVMFSGLCIRVP